MALDIFRHVEVIEAMENFMHRKRPPEHIRPKLDLGYKIENQCVIIFEIRPKWDNPEIKKVSEIAKTTFNKTKNEWKVYWLRANLKWYLYEPNPTVKTVKQFIKLVEEDKYNCFWG